MSYISKVWCLIDILAEDPFKRYLSFFLASCMRSNLNILGSWIFNPVMGCSMFFFSLPYRKWWWSPKATEKMQGDYFHEVRHRIAGDATEFRRKQKVNLWELSQRSRHSRGGEPPNISVTNYFLQDWSWQICCFHFQSQLFTDDKVSVSKSTNLSGFTENHRCIRFFSW